MRNLGIAVLVAVLAVTGTTGGAAAADELDGPGGGAVATEAPATEAPASEAPTAEAPATTPPPASAEPPASEPPATEAPERTAVPTTAPPTLAPPTTAPPTTPPPTTAPPTTPAPAVPARPPLAGAAPVFNPGNLISDFNFYNRWAMTEGEIQSFLNAQIGSCSNGQCLNVLRMDTPTRTWSFGHCSTYPGARGESAARIIYKVQQACGLSAKVILVTLQKEQSLVTSKGPSQGTLQKAMGYGCPDSDVCDSTYYGFFNQVFAAARQLTWYNDPDGSFTYIRVGQTNAIRYSPDAGCGSGNVFVSNRATAALYYYTPYQPNAAALANPYGTGDGCSAYGNRNFWYFYRDWFGDPTSTTPIPVTRLAGTDRYATAVAIAKNSYPTAGVPVAYVASGSDFPDALSAASAAATQGGPLLLVAPDRLPAPTEAGLRDLKPARIVVVGGTGAVSDGVLAALRAIAPTTRIDGVDRYETSRNIAEQVFPTVATAYLATGDSFADALSAGAASGSQAQPVLLVDGAAQAADPALIATLQRIGVTRVKIAGGTGAVTAGIADSIAAAGIAVTRLGDTDRYSTSVKIIQDAFGKTSTTAYLATGQDFPDALAGSAAAGHAKAPMYLGLKNCIRVSVRDHLVGSSVTSLRMLGGPGALSDNAAKLQWC